MSLQEAILLELHRIDAIVERGQEFVDSGALGVDDYAAIKQAARRFQDVGVDAIDGRATLGELREAMLDVLSRLAFI